MSSNINKLTDYIKIAYMPHEEFRIISQMNNIVGEGLQVIFYKRYFDSLTSLLHNNNADRVWHLYTTNAYYDAAIRNWCMIFGSYSEPTHYSKLLKYPPIKAKLESITSIKQLCRHDLLKFLLEDIDLANYKKFHSETKDYRDKYLTHREHHPSIIKDGELNYPHLNTCEKTLLSIFLLLIKVANTYPEEPNQANIYKIWFYNLSSMEQIKQLMEENFSPLSFFSNGESE